MGRHAGATAPVVGAEAPAEEEARRELDLERSLTRSRLEEE